MERKSAAERLRRIRTDIKELERDLLLLEELRAVAKSDGGRLTPFGRRLVGLFREHTEVRQAYVGKLLEISPGAVSMHYGKDDDM